MVSATTLLPGQTITRENLMEQTAITYPDTSVVQMTGVEIKQHLEKLCDKIFNDDAYQHLWRVAADWFMRANLLRN